MIDWLESIIGIMQTSRGGGVVLLAVLVCLAALLLAWLLLRRLKLWYWKVDLQVDALKGINQKLHKLEEGMTESVVFADKHETAEEEAAAEDGEEAHVPDIADAVYCVGKTGKIYTEEELEMLIKD
ncbi:MAG: hypothetical protein FWG42_01640 [Clostridiales bacterium]|nr:hypothetical protein [Clostridiales bacterium]